MTSRADTKPRRTFADIAASRKRYDPAAEGYGNPREWTGAFFSRMGFEEAQRVVSGQEKSPREILGVSERAIWAEITKAYKVKIVAHHPDRIATTGLTYEAAVEACKRINAAFAVLAREFAK